MFRFLYFWWIHNHQKPLTFILHIRNYTFHCFFLIVGIIEKKFGLISNHFMKSISKDFLHKLLKLNTSSRSVYGFDKMEIYCELHCTKTEVFQKRFLQWMWHIWVHLLNKSLTKNFIFCSVLLLTFSWYLLFLILIAFPQKRKTPQQTDHIFFLLVGIDC